MSYRVVVDENFHFMDPDERREIGIFDSAEDALAACRRIVENDLRDFRKPGMSAKELIAAYHTFGDDPFIVPIDGAPAVDFSAWDYAEQRAVKVCG
jgi:hypothetical protein